MRGSRPTGPGSLLSKLRSLTRTYLKILFTASRMVRPTHQIGLFKRWIGAQDAPYLILR